jgi:Family of unknown function (DUF6518)
MHAACAYDDRKATDQAAASRRSAVEAFGRAMAAGAANVAGTEAEHCILITDLLRRSGAFEEAAAQIATAPQDAEPFEIDCLAFEAALISAKDVAGHSMNDAHRWRRRSEQGASSEHPTLRPVTVVGVAAAGLVVGFLTLLGQRELGGAWLAAVNSGAVWLTMTFVAGAFMQSNAGTAAADASLLGGAFLAEGVRRLLDHGDTAAGLVMVAIGLLIPLDLGHARGGRLLGLFAAAPVMALTALAYAVIDWAFLRT